MNKQFYVWLLFVCFTATAQVHTPTLALTGQLQLSKVEPLAIYDDIIDKIIHLDAHELYHRFDNHFGRFVGEHAQPVTFDFIVGEQTSATTNELMYLFGKALGDGADIAPFTEFGIFPDTDGGYKIDYETHPFLIEVQTLLDAFSEASDMIDHSENLRQRGLRLDDVKRLRQFLQNHDIKYLEKQFDPHRALTLKALMPHLKLTIAKKHVLAEQIYFAQFDAISFVDDYLRLNVYRNRGIKLLATLDKRAQRILQSYIVERIRISRAASVSTSNSRNSLYWEEQINSGKIERKIESKLKEHAEDHQ